MLVGAEKGLLSMQKRRDLYLGRAHNPSKAASKTSNFDPDAIEKQSERRPSFTPLGQGWVLLHQGDHHSGLGEGTG